MKPINVYDYTAWQNRRGSSGLVASYGMRPADNPFDLSRQLAMCVAREGEIGLQKLADIHPDFDLIKQRIKINEPEEKTHSNACGCSSCNGSPYSNADGQTMKSGVSSRLHDKSELIITGGIVLIALAMVLKFTTK